MSNENKYLTKEHFDHQYKMMFELCYHRFRAKMQSESKKAEVKYCMMYPSIGSLYKEKEGLLIVGRALNGWNVNFDLQSITLDIMQQTQESFKEYEGTCPLAWIEKYDGKKENEREVISKSPFWQVTKGIAEQLYKNAPGIWHNHIAWTNLYKIAPYSGGNPNPTEQNAQWPDARYLIEKEIETLKPKYIVFITDTEWSKYFIGNLETYNGKYVQERGYLAGAKCIITIRPEQHSREPFVEEVVRAFEGL